mgnify:FL=1
MASHLVRYILSMLGGAILGANRKRNRQISFRVSEEEYNILQEKSTIANLSIPQYCKDVSLSKKINQPKVDHKGASEIALEVRRIGNNINQVAKHLNSGLGVTEGQINDLKGGLRHIWLMLNSILQK